MSAGDFTEVEAFTWTWVSDQPEAAQFVEVPNPPLELEQALPVVFLSHFVRLCRFLTAPGA
jgi:hypothetical protein